MNENFNGLKMLLVNIIQKVDAHIEKAKFDRTYDGIISSVNNDGYTVKYAGKSIDIKTKTTDLYVRGDKVKLCIPMANPRRAYILYDFDFLKGRALPNHLASVDSRNDNQSPLWYMQNYRMGVCHEFKYISKIGSPPINGTYCTLTTYIHWNDKSGGYPTQVAVGNSIVAIRSGVNDTSWSEWKLL